METALTKLLGFRWVDKGYGTSTCRSCGALREIEYGDHETPPSEHVEPCSRSCPWRVVEEWLDEWLTPNP